MKVRPFATRRDARFRHAGNRAIEARPSLWDSWLPRLSHLSQFGLFVFTIGTIYFTVIPLYQKALLEEAIAKKEIELGQTSNALLDKEKALRTAQLELDQKVKALGVAQDALAKAELKTYVQQRQYELAAFASSTSLECSGLMDASSDPAMVGTGPFKHKPYMDIFKRNPLECLTNQYRSGRLRTVLSDSDRLMMDGIVDTLAKKLLGMKEAAMREVQELPGRARENPALLKPMTGYAAKHEKFLELATKFMKSPPPQEGSSLDRLIAWNQEEIALNHRKQQIDEISRLRQTTFAARVR